MATTDTKLVERSNAGDRDAFAEIVEKYQSLICSIAYAITGSFSSSEELAQETFVSAWQSLPELREPSRLKQWLSGITRNLSRNRVRRHQHDVLQAATTIETESPTDTQIEEPISATIAQEEIDLLDSVIAELPEEYREPLVLFYREEESVARVAELLELSTDAVKQRLSRGRKMLREEVAAKVERGLRRTIPARAFTLGVLAALPVMSSTAQAATLGASTVGASSVGTAKGASALSAVGLSGAILGPIAGLLGGWFGYSMSMKSARSDRERALIKQMTGMAMVLVLIVSLGLGALIWLGTEAATASPLAFAGGVVLFILFYIISLFGTILWGNRRIAEIRRETGTVDDPIDAHAKRLPQFMQAIQSPRIYESKARFLGLPILSIRFQGASSIGKKKQPAVGWIAIGDIAYGVLFASGSFSVGAIAVGAVGVGLISFGGLAIGGLAMGGAAFGWWSLGGMGIGYLVFGGVALAWKAAMGGVAIAHELAIGGVVVGEHMNDEVAKAFVEQSSFFALGGSMMTPWSWWIVTAICLVPMLLAMKLTSPKKVEMTET